MVKGVARKGARGKRRHQERGKVQVINTAKWVWKMGVAIGIETRIFPAAAGDVSTPPSKQPRYELTKHQKTLIKSDSKNDKLWEDLLVTAKSLGTVSGWGCLE